MLMLGRSCLDAHHGIVAHAWMLMLGRSCLEAHHGMLVIHVLTMTP